MSGEALDDAYVDALRRLFEHDIVFNRVIGLRVDRIGAERTTGSLAMRPDLMGSTVHQRLHGGVISTALDAIAGVAVMGAVGARHRGETVAERMERFVRLGTIDLRVDYLRQARGRDYTLLGHVLRLGSRVASVRMEFADADGALVAAGSATYIVS